MGKMGRPSESWAHTAPETVTVTTPASAYDYLTSVANGQTKAAGLKRPTVAALQQAAKALGLADRIDHAPYGYHVGKGWDVAPCSNLKSAASHLLAALARAPYAAAPAPELTTLPLIRKIQAAAPARVLLPGEAVAPAAPAPAGPAPELPAFVTHQQQQQQPQQGREYRSPARGGRVAWDEPGESAAALAPRAARAVWGAASEAVRSGEASPALLERVAAEITGRPPAAPARVVAPGPLARKVAPARLPVDVVALLQRFSLSLEGLLTVGASNAKLAKGTAEAWPVILHHLPARSLAAALLGPEAGTTAPRSRLPGLADLAKATGTLALGMSHDGCPWKSAGCSDGCLAWSGHGGMGTVPAAARARRTLAYLADSPAYARAILWAIAKAYRQAQSKGLPLAVRLRGTDDLAWHLQRLTVSPAEAVSLARRYGLPVAPGEGQTLTEALSLAPAGSIRPYEYSKAPVAGPLGLQAQRAAGWDVTASLAADRPGGCADAAEAVAAGFRVAVPVAIRKGQPLPPVLMLRPSPDAPVLRLLTVDGDLSDHRWLDPQGPQPGGFDGIAVLLRTKVSRGRGPAAAAFSLAPTVERWQPLAGGGHAALSHTTWVD
jgi:hypothetical protein